MLSCSHLRTHGCEQPIQAPLEGSGLWRQSDIDVCARRYSARTPRPSKHGQTDSDPVTRQRTPLPPRRKSFRRSDSSPQNAHTPRQREHHYVPPDTDIVVMLCAVTSVENLRMCSPPRTKSSDRLPVSPSVSPSSYRSGGIPAPAGDAPRGRKHRSTTHSNRHRITS
jgi:hypothetical protein